MAAEAATERGFLDLAYAMGLPIVATNDVYFPKSDMYEAHDALICIAEGAYVDQSEPAPPPDAAALFQDRIRDVRAVCRSAGSAGKHRRDRAALRL